MCRFMLAKERASNYLSHPTLPHAEWQYETWKLNHQGVQAASWKHDVINNVLILYHTQTVSTWCNSYQLQLMIKPWRCEDALWACLLTGHDEPSPASHHFLLVQRWQPGRFVWWNKSFTIYVWRYVQVCKLYTDVFAVDTFCNRRVLFKNTFLWTYLDLKRILPKQLHLTVWSCLHRHVFRQTTVTLGHRQKLMATGGSLSWIWIAFEWDLETYRFYFKIRYTWSLYIICWRIQRCRMFNGSILKQSWLTYKEETWAGLFSNKPELCVWCWMFQDSAEFIHTACSNHVGPNGFWEPYCALGVGGLRGEIIIPA